MGRLNMGFEINWNVKKNDDVLLHPMYQKYSGQNIGAIVLPQVQTDLAGIKASNEAAPIANYLSWVIRTVKLNL